MQAVIDKEKMMDCVRKQLSLDYNCSPDDFLKEGLIFTKAIPLDGRRPFPFRSPRVEMVTMGNSVIVNASNDIMPYVRKQFITMTRDEVFYVPFFYGICEYLVPDIDKITALNYPGCVKYEMIEGQNVADLNKLKGFENALKYHACPVRLVFLAKDNDKIIGIAGASADCEMLWSIGVDVSSQYRNKGIATSLVNMVTLEVLNRGFIPYYYVVGSNTASLHVAIKAGYIPAWRHTYKAMLESNSIVSKVKYRLRKSLK